MNGAHDLGGAHGLGAITQEQTEPVFHHAWERRCFALTLAMGAVGSWNLDMSRFAREQMEPGEYLTTSYYLHWLHGLEHLLLEKGLASAEEITSGKARRKPAAIKRALAASEVTQVLAKGAPVSRELKTVPKFNLNDAITVRNFNPKTHTRAPRYLRSRRGTISRAHGGYIFPDAHASGQGEQPQHLYSVCFSAAELWGADGEVNHYVYADLWENYLEAQNP